MSDHLAHQRWMLARPLAVGLTLSPTWIAAARTEAGEGVLL